MITIFVYDRVSLKVIAKPIVDSFESFTINPTGYYPDFDIEKHIVSKNELVNPVLENGILREKSNEELYLEGSYTLKEGEIYNEVTEKIEKVSIPDGIYKPTWNIDKKEWIESATQEEIDIILFNKRLSLFNSELESYKTIFILHGTGLVSLEEFELCKEYIISLDPYSNNAAIDRPVILDKYKTKNYNNVSLLKEMI